MSRFALTDALAIVLFATIGLLDHDGHLSLHGYARDVLPLAAGWFTAFACFRGRFLPTWLVGTVLGVAIRTVALGHYRLNVLAFLVVSLVFLGLTAGLMRIAVRRLGGEARVVQDRHVTDHRQLGVDLFNETWRLIESREDDTLMIDCAHASAYHWALAPECKPENRARSAWQISRAYTVAGRSAEALYHAERCFQLCERHALGDWDLAYAYEALARASLAAGDHDAAGQYVELAQAVEIADEGDRAHLADDLKTLR